MACTEEMLEHYMRRTIY